MTGLLEAHVCHDLLVLCSMGETEIQGVVSKYMGALLEGISLYSFKRRWQSSQSLLSLS